MSDDHAQVPPKRDHPILAAVVRVVTVLVMALLLGLLSRYAAILLGQSADVANTVGGLAAVIGAYLGWRYWRPIFAAIAQVISAA